MPTSPNRRRTVARKKVCMPKVKAKYERRAKKQNRRSWNLALSDSLKGKDLQAKH